MKKDWKYEIARDSMAFVILVFVSLFYKDNLFTFFAALAGYYLSWVI